MKRLTMYVAAAALSLLTASSAQAALDELPMRLPSAAGSRAAIKEPSTWLIGARPGAVTARIARAHGARQLSQKTGYQLPAARARAFAADLRAAGVLTYAEPNVRIRRKSAFDSSPQSWARRAIVEPGIVPPAPGPAAIAIIDDLVDTSLPDLSHVKQVNPGPVLGPHGTMVASAAAAQFNGSGVFGVFPGAPMLSFGLPLDIFCADAANAIVAAANADVRVINLSFGTPADCESLFIAVQYAYGHGSLVVASAGNEFAEGNPIIFPAAYPHVLSVAAIEMNGLSAGFSNANTSVDVSAPGVGVPVAIPKVFDVHDGVVDGVTTADGTSFSSPMVAGAAAWLATSRPTLSNGQLADVLRGSAFDLPPAGYDADTGFGLVQMGKALAAPTPEPDILEPNDGITFVNGTVFGKADPYVWRGKGTKKLNGTVDQVEDPVDVYRIRVRKHSRIRIRLKPRFGDPNLYIYSGKAKTLNDSSKVKKHSIRGPGKTDSIRLTNKSHTRTFYVAVNVSGQGGLLNAAYRLQFRRLKR